MRAVPQLGVVACRLVGFLRSAPSQGRPVSAARLFMAPLCDGAPLATGLRAPGLPAGKRTPPAQVL